ncbi:Leucine aminopeptidase 2 [Musa troglodytarum]|uniref:Leucine aminopeptidase 2 n=1 Tax=Musa troglodytarum TaxID=320322 RepID=A0A9E7L2S0_9LILI|nr:Leucine aminopeptidase 2 [Musa troglodytarum]
MTMAAATVTASLIASRLSYASSSTFACPRRYSAAVLCFARLRRPPSAPAFRRRLGRMGHSTAAAAAAAATTRATLGLTKPDAVEIPQIAFAARELDFVEWKGDILAVAVSEKDLKKDSDSKFENLVLKRLDEKLGGLLAEASTEEDFTGKSGQSTVLRLPGLGFKRLGLLGLGSPSSSVTAYQGIGEAVAAVAKAAQASNAAVCLASLDGMSEEAKLHAASAIASGTVLGVYEDNRFKSESKKPLLKTVDIIGFGSGSQVDQKLKYATDVCSGVIFGKELVNAPANVLTPATLGAAKALGEIKPPGVEVHFIVAACENMISGTGMRPGDIVTASNGKTIEVNNTDAEGRLTLADALIYACNQGIEKVVDLATLTGACVVALGPSIAGFFSPNDDLAKEIVAASEATGEKFWRMPLEDSYWESMKSGVADMVNTGGRQGGAITAALFLKQFVDEKVQWLHIDMAGPVWNDKKRAATGFGVSTLIEWVLKNSL